MTQRIYLVTDRSSNVQRLVRAATQAQARNHVARATIGVQVAAQETLVDLLSEGVKVETAGEADDEPLEVGMKPAP
jgi:hypothetical protein